MSPSANNLAFTAPINPPGSPPALTRAQIWNGLLLKISSAETFVPVIASTGVISTTTDPSTGNPVTVRDIVFKEGNKRARETVTAFADSRVEFVQEDGAKVQNVISENAKGELHMTYVFEWRHPGAEEEELKDLYENERKMARMGVEGTIKAMKRLAEEGKI